MRYNQNLSKEINELLMWMRLTQCDNDDDGGRWQNIECVESYRQRE